MLLEETLEIVKDILLRTDISNIKIKEANDPVYGEIDPKTEDFIEDTLKAEYDLVITEDLCHSEIQEIDEILEPFSYVEMKLRDGNLEIFSTRPNEKKMKEEK